MTNIQIPSHVTRSGYFDILGDNGQTYAIEPNPLVTRLDAQALGLSRSEQGKVSQVVAAMALQFTLLPHIQYPDPAIDQPCALPEKFFWSTGPVTFLTRSDVSPLISPQ